MRLAPVVRWLARDAGAAVRRAAESSRTIHAAAECACRLFAEILGRALEGRAGDDVLVGSSGSFDGAPRVDEIARGAYRDEHEDDIRGSGCVVESREAALSRFVRSESFEEAVLRAANLGDDADTTAAVRGQVAGAHRGVDVIPARRLLRLAMHARILDLADALRRAPGPSPSVR